MTVSSDMPNGSGTASSESTPPTAGDVRERSRDRRHSLALLAVTVSAGRWLFAADRRIFHLVPDELAIAGMARWFSGTAGWNMLETSTWQPGYSLILAPLFWVFDSPVGVYRSMIVMNALLGGLAAVQLALLLRRMSSLTLNQRLVISGLVSLMPSALSASAHVWAEPLVTVLFLATVSTAITASATANPFGWYLPIITAGLAYLAHARMLPMLPMAIGLAVIFAIQRRNWRWVLLYLGAGAASYVAVRSFSNWVFSHVWETQQEENTVISTLERARHIGPVLDALMGQVWYQLISTALLVALGFIVLVRAAAGRSLDPSLSPSAARVTILLVAPLVATSAVFMSNRARPDQLVYGRYNDAVLPLVVALGAGWLVRAAQTGMLKSIVRPLAISAVIAIEAGFFIRQFHAKQIQTGEAIKPMIAGLAPALGTSTTVPVLRVTLIALLVTVLLLAVTWRSRTATLPIAAISAVLIVASALGTHHSFEARRNDLASASAVTEVRDTLADTDEVGVALIPSFADPSVAPIHQLSYALTYAWYLPEIDVRVDLGLDDDVGPYVFSPDNDSLLLPGAGVIVWEDSERKMALWREAED